MSISTPKTPIARDRATPRHWGSPAAFRPAPPLLGWVLAGLLAACGSTPEPAALSHPGLDQARAQLQDLRAQRDAATYAGPELRLAGEALGEAEQAALAGAPAGEVERLAATARERTGLAQALAASRRAGIAAAERSAADDRLLAANRPVQVPSVSGPSPPPVVGEPPDWPALGGTLGADGPRLLLGEAAFGAKLGHLRATGERQLQRLAAVLQAQPQRRARIRGLSEGPGDARLAEERVERVREALVDLGISGTRLVAPVPGQALPASGPAAGGVEIVLSDAAGAFASP